MMDILTGLRQITPTYEEGIISGAKAFLEGCERVLGGRLFTMSPLAVDASTQVSTDEKSIRGPWLVTRRGKEDRDKIEN